MCQKYKVNQVIVTIFDVRTSFIIRDTEQHFLDVNVNGHHSRQPEYLGIFFLFRADFPSVVYPLDELRMLSTRVKVRQTEMCVVDYVN